MTRTVLVLLSTARRLRLGPCTPLGSGGEAQLMRWARSLQVVTCSGRNGGMWAPDDGIWRCVSVVGEAGEVCDPPIVLGHTDLPPSMAGVGPSNGGTAFGLGRTVHI